MNSKKEAEEGWCELGYFYLPIQSEGFPGGSDGEESACNAGYLGLIPRLGRSPGEGHGNPLQYSCLENPKDRGAWQTVVHRVAKSWTQLKRLSMHTNGFEDDWSCEKPEMSTPSKTLLGSLLSA